MSYLTYIFPGDYLDIPTCQDIELMLQEILNRSDSVDGAVYKIDQETCPYYKEALICCLEDKLPNLYQSCSELAGYYSDGHWIPYWQDPKAHIRELKKKYQQQQASSADIYSQEKLEAKPLEITKVIKQVGEETINCVKQVVCDSIQEIAPNQAIQITQHITIPIYIVNGDNNGTFAAQYTNNHHQ